MGLIKGLIKGDVKIVTGCTYCGRKKGHTSDCIYRGTR